MTKINEQATAVGTGVQHLAKIKPQVDDDEQRDRQGIKDPSQEICESVESQMAALGIDRVVTGKVLNHVSVDRDTVTGLVYDRHGMMRKSAERLSVGPTDWLKSLERGRKRKK